MAHTGSLLFLVLCLALCWAGESTGLTAHSRLNRDDEVLVSESAECDTDPDKPRTKYEIRKAEEMERRQVQLSRNEKATKEVKKQKRREDYEALQEKLAKEKVAQEEARKNRQLKYEEEVEERAQKKLKAQAPTVDPRDPSARGSVTLRLKGPSNIPSLTLEVPLGQRLGVVAQKGSEHFRMKDINKVRLIFHGEVLKRSDTAEMHGFRQGDVLDIKQDS
uniref:Ubiquitin-like domain-containing protein n=1 Tax=Alexandrium catenella TaxID=2925 RepID=A0A7S1SFT3_ALECA